MKKMGNKVLVIGLIMALFLTSFGFSATIGTSLNLPDSGWKRIDEMNNNIVFKGPWTAVAPSNILHWNKSSMLGSFKESTIHFKFYGTKIRVLAETATNRYNDINITIDNIPYTMNQYTSSVIAENLVFEKQGLTAGVHDVIITPPSVAPAQSTGSSPKYYSLDAIDIDDTGYLVKTDDIIGLDSKLYSPEIGWSRYDDRDSKIIVDSPNQVRWSDPSFETWLQTATLATEGTIKIKFYGSKFRLLGHVNPDRAKENFVIKVDGTSYNSSQYKEVHYGSRVFFEKLNLDKKIHTIEIVMPVTASGNYSFDCIDIDEAGYLLPANEPDPTTQGSRAILLLYLTNGTIKEYDLSKEEIESFLLWYDTRQNGTGTSYYVFRVNYNVRPFLGRKEYIPFDKIFEFEIKDYNE